MAFRIISKIFVHILFNGKVHPISTDLSFLEKQIERKLARN